MPVLVVGKTEIPYVVRFSDTATRRRVVVTPGRVEVVAPTGSGKKGIEEFVQRKRRWIYDKVETVNQAAAKVSKDRPSRYATGAKIVYRGRRLKLTVRRSLCEKPSVRYQNGFLVEASAEASDQEIRAALEAWMKDRVRRDIEEVVRRFSTRLGAKPKAIRVRALSENWGSCGEGGTLHFDWRLIQAPKAVLEYAVVHEMVHLRVRGHGKVFWSKVRELLPGYEGPKEWLRRHEAELD